MLSVGFRVHDFGFGFQGYIIRVSVVRSRGKDFRFTFRAQGFWTRVWGLGFRLKGLGLKFRY